MRHVRHYVSAGQTLQITLNDDVGNCSSHNCKRHVCLDARYSNELFLRDWHSEWMNENTSRHLSCRPSDWAQLLHHVISTERLVSTGCSRACLFYFILVNCYTDHYLVSYFNCDIVSFVMIYRKRCFRENGVLDHWMFFLAGSESCVRSAKMNLKSYNKTKKPKT